MIDTPKRTRGRPPGSKNKPKIIGVPPETRGWSDVPQDEPIDENQWHLLSREQKAAILDKFSTPPAVGITYPNIFTDLFAKDGLATGRGYYMNTREDFYVDLTCRYQ